MDWYKKTVEELYDDFNSSATGLKENQRIELLSSNGENILTTKKQKSNIQRFLEQFNDLLIYVLIASAVLKGILGDYVDMSVILLVVIINSLIGYIQESKALSSISGLSKMLSDSSTIMQNGEKQVVESSSLVPGDIVLLKAGDIVPADIRLIEAFNLNLEEAILTGESLPILKDNNTISKEMDLGDRLNMVYSGTLVSSGSGKGIVVGTGDSTELGKISTHLNDVETTMTPLLLKIKKLNKQIFYFLAILMVVLIFLSYFRRDFTNNEILSAIIALAVSAIPEGLPAVLSLILSLGVSKMAREKSIIKKMPAVETLGSMDIICSDKTGTLTKNEMTVLTVVTKDKILELDSSYSFGDNIELTGELENFKIMTQTALFCNDTVVTNENGVEKIIGNPTEGALLKLAKRISLGGDNETLDKIPFDSSYKYMAVLERVNNEKYIFLKGAPDIILNKVSKELENGEYKNLTLSYWEENIQKYGSLGQRMLAAAYKKVDSNVDKLTHDMLKENLIFAGLYGIVDPPKIEAIEAISICHNAGISVKMITGDHKDTALAIGKQIGLKNYKEALIGSQLEEMSDEELDSKVLDIDVYARTTPEHKLRIVTALQTNNKIIGMTGDGVNDAPALKKADIGIAMGIKGTEVTKDTADMVLADDNFATIAKAVKVGRHVYDNLKKTIYFLIPTAFAQGLLVVVSILMNRPLPLTSLQILWLNMVSTITLSFALGFEPAAENIMNRKPRNIDENILDGYAIFRIGYVSILIAFAGFLMNIFLRNTSASLEIMQTALMQTIIFGQVFYMINCREIYKFSINKGILTNKILWISILTLGVLQFIMVSTKFMNEVFGTTKIGLNYLGLAVLLGLGVFIIVEIEKFISRNTFLKGKIEN